MPTKNSSKNNPEKVRPKWVAIKPEPVLVGISLEQWRMDQQRLAWAQHQNLFKEIVGVVQNESYLALAPIPGGSESRMLGRAEGYHMALEVLRSMARHIELPAPQLEPTYEADTGGEQ